MRERRVRVKERGVRGKYERGERERRGEEMKIFKVMRRDKT